jgi:glutamate synthase domain-containing protein 3
MLEASWYAGANIPGGVRPGSFIGTGMHGGVIYMRGTVEDYQLGKEVGISAPDAGDIKILEELVGKYASYFGQDAGKIMSGEFIKLYPRSLRPYGRLYTY